MSSETMTLCLCGEYHPLGYVCEKARELARHRDEEARLRAGHSTSDDTHQHEHAHEAACRGHGHAHEHKHVHEAACCDHDHAHEHDQAHERVHESACCGHDHAHEHVHASSCRGHDHDHDHACDCGLGHHHEPVQEVDAALLASASDTRAIYRIMNMDCPVEEALIRKRLATVEGITHLEFNLMQRVLTVDHTLSDTRVIEDALRSIDMAPEAVLQDTTTVFSVTGMDCPEEERLIRKALQGMAGVRGLEFNLMQRTLTVVHAPGALPDISTALAGLNMGARLLTAREDNEAAPAHDIPWKKLCVATVFAALAEAFELMREWGARPFGIDVNSLTVAGEPVFHLIPLCLAIIAIVLSGVTTFKKGWLAVRNMTLNMYALMSVAVTGAVCIGQYPEAAMVMVLFNISEAIEARALDKARNAIKELLALAPQTATVRRADGSWRQVDVREVAVGSRVRVRPGEKVALDGVVLSGSSTVNQAPITGESMPVEKTTGSVVYAGTINESGSFEFETTATSHDSTLSRIINAVEEAQGTRAPIQRFVDTFARYYTPCIFIAAILAAIIPPLAMGHAWRESIYIALVILVISCPCALVISVPVSLVSGMAAATRSGILVKGGIFLEQGRLLRCLALDKTGTITHGKPRQTNFVRVGNLPEHDIEKLTWSLTSRSDHPVSRALARGGEESHAELSEVRDFTALPGKGVSGVMNGRRWFLGNHQMVEDMHICSPALEEHIFGFEKEGRTVVVLCSSDGAQAVFAVADTVRETSVAAIAELRKLGVRTVMLTGDNEHTAKAIGAQVGVDEVRASLLPGDKLSIIEELQGRSLRVGMVGDGINDAPALARADIGFAMARGGTDTAIETADVALMDDDLRKIPRFIALSRSTFAILVGNISLALIVKAVFFALTLSGNATMWMAVFADVGTSLIVVLNGMRAARK